MTTSYVGSGFGVGVGVGVSVGTAVSTGTVGVGVVSAAVGVPNTPSERSSSTASTAAQMMSTVSRMPALCDWRCSAGSRFFGAGR